MLLVYLSIEANPGGPYGDCIKMRSASLCRCKTPMSWDSLRSPVSHDCCVRAEIEYIAGVSQAEGPIGTLFCLVHASSHTAGRVRPRGC